MSGDEVAFLSILYGPRCPYVLCGPFAGMVYVEQAVGSVLVPKLLGCYEQELHGVWSVLLRRQPRQVLNIGCGEGYYAVGLATRLPGIPVLASDTDAHARVLCAELARKNGVAEQVRIEGAWECEQLSQHLQPGTLVVCDCEGAEWELLRPDLVPQLEDCDLIVELHEFAVSGVTQALVKRFTSTHDVTIIPAREREPALFRQLLERAAAAGICTVRSPDWDQDLIRRVLSENRPAGMSWALLLAHRYLFSQNPKAG